MEFSKFTFIALTSISNASPAVITAVDHKLTVDDEIWLETTGALPASLEEDTTYYVVNDNITVDSFCISASKRGTPINTSSAGSGTHSFQKQNRARLKPTTEDNK